MRVVLFLNGPVGAKVAEFLRHRPDVDIVAAVLHPEAERRAGERILQSLSLPKSLIIDGSKLEEDNVIRTIAACSPELGISVYFRYIIQPSFLDLFPRGCVNLHPSLLPWNRGANTNIWPIVEHTPAGVTLHMIDSGIDTGAILSQKIVPVYPTDTGKTLYRRLERAAFTLFRRQWLRLVSGTLEPMPQPVRARSFHRSRDVAAIDAINLDKRYLARELIDILRARTFSPYSGAYFMVEGRKVYLRLHLAYE